MIKTQFTAFVLAAVWFKAASATPAECCRVVRTESGCPPESIYACPDSYQQEPITPPTTTTGADATPEVTPPYPVQDSCSGCQGTPPPQVQIQTPVFNADMFASMTSGQAAAQIGAGMTVSGADVEMVNTFVSIVTTMTIEEIITTAASLFAGEDEFSNADGSPNFEEIFKMDAIATAAAAANFDISDFDSSSAAGLSTAAAAAIAAAVVAATMF